MELLARKTEHEVLSQLAAIERENGARLKDKEKVYALFHGEGRGSMTQAAKGTAWGLFNAVAEYEDYYKKARRAESRAFGAGADRKAKAFEECLALVW